MPRVYEICADEAWTHGGHPLNRYWCFFGGVLGLESSLWKTELALEAVAKKHNHKGEVKWANVSAFSSPIYKELVDAFFDCLERYDLKYRQTFLDRAFVYVPEDGEGLRTDLDTQYRVYYQFLKHHFGLKFLPRAEGGFDTVFIRLDRHPSIEHTTSLKKFAEDLPRQLSRTDLNFIVSFVNSKKHLRLQICDVIMGAAGSRGNRLHDRRPNGQRGMTLKQKLRYDLSGYIYNKLKTVVMRQRGAGAFNWFESTGQDGNPINQLEHKVRIWKFIPRRHNIDKGWQNVNLDKHGNYVRPEIVSPPQF